MKNNNIKPISLLMAAIVLQGCAANLKPTDDFKAIESEVNAAVEADNARRNVSPPVPIKIPREAPWLADTVTARYNQNLTASQAIKVISQGRPVRFNFVPEKDPKVSSPIGAITFQDHLDAICSYADWTYFVANGVVMIDDMETKSFPLAVFPGEDDGKIPFKSLGLSDTEQSSDAQNMATLKLDPWAQEIPQLIEGILGLDKTVAQSGNESGVQTGIDPITGLPFELGVTPGSVIDPNNTQSVVEPLRNITGADPRSAVTVLPSANMVMVTAKPSMMRKVERELSNYEHQANRKAWIQFTFYDIDVSNSEDRNIEANIIRDAAISVGGVLPGIVPDGGGTFSLSFNEKGSPWAGSELMMQWLETMGTTTIAYEDTVEILNNRIGSVDNVRSERIVSRVAQESQVSGSTETQTPTVDFEFLETGIAVHMQPTIINDQINVRIAISRAALVDEENYNFGDGAVTGTNPVTEGFNRKVNVSLKNGESKLLTRLTTDSNNDQRGTNKLFPFIGDTVDSLSRDRQTVMLMTAYIL